MKKFLILFLFMSMFVLFGCETNDNPNNENKGNEEVELLEFEGVTFTDMNVIYNGEPHTIEVKGAPDFAIVEYENEGPYTEVGVYEINALVYAEGYVDLELTATLTISSGETGLTFEKYNRYVVNKPYTELPHTVEMDIKLNPSVSGGAGTLFGNLDWVVYGDASVGVGRVFHIDIQNGELRLIYTNKYNTREEITFSGVDLRTGNWVNVALTIDAAKKTAFLYVNGTLRSSKSISAELSDLILETKYHVGGDNRTLNPYWFKGEMRQLTVFSNVRSADEIKYDYENGVAVDEDGLMAQYTLTSNRIHKDIEDNSGNGYWVRYEDTWYDEDEVQMDYDHSFAFVGDTQMLNYWGDDNDMDTLYKWIVDNTESQKIGHVFGLGDITETWTKTEAVAAKEWGKAQKAIYQMNGKVSYSLVRGNHDESGRFNEYFNQTPYTSQMTGFFDSKIDTGYKLLKVGNVDYLFMCLDFGASDAELEWAGNIVSQYPNHKVIVTTHGYLEQEGNAMGEDYPHSPSDGSDFENDPNYNHGKGMWDKFISQYENIVMVVSGHINDEDIVYSQRYGVNGNVVTQILIDFQDVDKQLVQADGQETAGIVVMMYMSEDGSKAELLAYSTIRDKYYKKYNHFTINLNGVCEDGHKLTHHDLVEETCTTDGNIEYDSCSVCGANYDVDGNIIFDVILEKTGHSYDSGVANGNMITYTCDTCGDSYVEYIDCTIIVNYLYLDGTVASAQQTFQSSKGKTVTVNAKTIDGYVPSHDYVKLYMSNNSNVVNFYYSQVDVWNGSSVSSSLSGSGTQTDPYLIQSGADLAYVASVTNSENASNKNSFAGKYFKLTKSIDLNNNALYIGTQNGWGNGFAGFIEGNNCTIRNINNQYPLIGGMYSGSVQNLSLYGRVQSTRNYVAALISYAYNTTLHNITSYVNVTGINGVAGIVSTMEQNGRTSEGLVNYGTINATGWLNGGLVGKLGGNLNDSINWGTVICNGDANTGGIAGGSQDKDSWKGTLTNCVNYGTLYKVRSQLIGNPYRITFVNCNELGEFVNNLPTA